MKKTVVVMGLILALISMGIMVPSRAQAAPQGPPAPAGIQIPINLKLPCSR